MARHARRLITWIGGAALALALLVALAAIALVWLVDPNAWRARPATFFERAGSAGRIGAPTHRGTQVHDGLGVTRHVLLRRELRGVTPQIVCQCLLATATRQRKHARQHAPHIAIEYGMRLVAGQRKDGPRSGASDTRKRGDAVKVRRKFAIMLITNLLRSPLQVARTGVVAQAGPQVQHFIHGRIGQCAHVGEARDETLEIRDNGCDLRLLQHHFGHPHAIRRALALPGQVVAAGTRVPVQQLGAIRHQCAAPWPLRP